MDKEMFIRWYSSLNKVVYVILLLLFICETVPGGIEKDRDL